MTDIELVCTPYASVPTLRARVTIWHSYAWEGIDVKDIKVWSDDEWIKITKLFFNRRYSLHILECFLPKPREICIYANITLSENRSFYKSVKYTILEESGKNENAIGESLIERYIQIKSGGIN